MADPSFHTRLEHVCLRADGTQQAVAHFTHDSFGASLLTLVFAGAQVDLRSADQSIRFPRDVRVKAFEFIRHKCDSLIAHCIRLGQGVCKQCLYFVTQFVNFLMGKTGHEFRFPCQWIFLVGFFGLLASQMPGHSCRNTDLTEGL